MVSVIKNLIAHFYQDQRANQMLCCCYSLVLASMFYLTINPSALALPLYFSENQSSSGIFLTQKGDNKIPPSVVNAVRQDLSRRTNIPIKELKFQQAKRQTWPNGCLGLASPDQFCTQALVEGWQVVMVYKNKTWVYRTDSQGRTLRIEN